MKTLRAVIVLLVLLVAAGLAFVFSGLYNVAADDEHTNPVQWILRTTQSRSVHRRAEEVKPPAWMASPDPSVVRRGLLHYEDACAVCHGAPGLPISPIGQGLNPPPPELSSHAEEPGESFWIIKHGIKMTGMPSFGATYDDEEIWAIVAFLQAMPEMTKEEYESMAGEVGAGGEGLQGL